MDIAADCIVAGFGRIVAADYTVAGFGHTVAADYTVAGFGRTVAADCIVVGFGRTVAAEDCNSSVHKIGNKLVEPPADSFGVLPVEGFAAHVQDPSAPVARPEKCSSREQSAGRRLDWRSGRRPPAVAWNFAASAPLSRLPVAVLDLEPFATFPAP